ncbi:MAG: hypothetical protein ACREJC_00380 [Tepidisphaeraceae bacterium]
MIPVEKPEWKEPGLNSLRARAAHMLRLCASNGITLDDAEWQFDPPSKDKTAWPRAVSFARARIFRLVSLGHRGPLFVLYAEAESEIRSRR